MATNKTRYMRDYQAQRRGSRSHKTEVERLKIAMAMERGEITEGLAAKVLGLDRIAVRGFVIDSANEGLAIANEIADGLRES